MDVISPTVILERIGQVMDRACQALSLAGTGLAPGLELALAAGLAGLAAAAMCLALRAGKKTASTPREEQIPARLKHAKALIELLPADAAKQTPAVKCVISKVNDGTLRCELAGRTGPLGLGLGSEVLCLFPAMLVDGKRINSFRAGLVAKDAAKAGQGRITLAGPRDFGLSSQRRQTRKRVKDQRFVRLRLWVSGNDSQAMPYPDAAPHVAVNLSDSGTRSKAAGRILNISKGGLGLVLGRDSLPKGLSPGSEVVLNLSMFNVRETMFRPYWYSGAIKSLVPAGAGAVRVGLGFIASGRISPLDGGRIIWD
ncbi:MAG: hypothetical protein PHV85_08240 [Desulfovibrionaceae bacterium]|nr:hypothetical protein [Desulfovibrionaceae bacterium]